MKKRPQTQSQSATLMYTHTATFGHAYSHLLHAHSHSHKQKTHIFPSKNTKSGRWARIPSTPGLIRGRSTVRPCQCDLIVILKKGNSGKLVTLAYTGEITNNFTSTYCKNGRLVRVPSSQGLIRGRITVRQCQYDLTMVLSNGN